MISPIFDSGGNTEVRFIGFFKKSPPLHLYMMQFIGFSYLGYRFASRNYTVYGFLPDEAFNYSRTLANQFVPLPVLHFTTFQFIYDFLPRPTPDVIAGLQYCIIFACLMGVLGVGARWMAGFVFILGAHLTGMVQASNADIDGGTLPLCLMLILTLVPSKYFYGWKNGFNLERRSENYHWPVVVLFIIVGSWYSFSGIAKIIDIGPHWPFVLHLEKLASIGIQQSLYLYSDYRNPLVSYVFQSYPLSVLGGLITLIVEAGFISILFVPRLRMFFVCTMILFHSLVLLMHGINFFGNSLIMLLCLDWNILVRKITVYYDGECVFCQRSLQWMSRFDWFRRISYRPISTLTAAQTDIDTGRLQHAMGVQDENREVYYGADGFEQITTRSPALIWFALLMKIPGFIYVARYVYRIIARNRMMLGCRPDSQCQLPSEL